MLSAACRRRPEDLRRLPFQVSAFLHSTSSIFAALIEQFLPEPRSIPPPFIPRAQHRDLLHALAGALKTEPHFFSALRSLSFSCPSSFSDLLLRLPRAASLTLFSLAVPNVSPATLKNSCSAALLVSAGSRFHTVLAGDMLAALLLRVPPSARPAAADVLLGWADLHLSLRTHYAALHIVLRAFLGAGMAAQSLAALGRVRSANKIPSLTAHAVILRLLFQVGDTKNAWKLFVDMFLRGPRPSTRTFNSIMLGFCKKGNILVADALLKVMHKFQCQPEPCSYNILIKALCVFDKDYDAFTLFDYMRESSCSPNISTYNTLMDSLCAMGRVEAAIELFTDMEDDGIEANTITYNVLLNGICKAGKIGVADAVLRKMKGRGFLPDCYTLNILAAGHSKFGKGSNIEILMKDLVDVPAFARDGSGWDMVVSRLCWEGKLDEACSLVQDSIAKGIPVSLVAFNSVIAGYCKGGLYETAFDLYGTMLATGLFPSAATCNSLLMGLCRSQRWSDAQEMLSKIIDRGFSANKYAFTIFLDECFRVGDVDSALKTWDDMERRRIFPDVIAFSAYINGLSVSNLTDKAYEAFRVMVDRGLVPNNFIYNSLIYGFFRTGNVTEASSLKEIMMQNGLVPDVITYNTFLSARCKEAFFCAVKFPDKMLSEGYEPDIFTYNIWMHGLCSRQLMNQATKLLNSFPFGVAPDTVTYNIMINGICADVRVNAVVLTGKLLKMGFSSDVVTVNILLSHLCKQGLAMMAVAWKEKLIQSSFCFSNATLNILEYAYREVRQGVGHHQVEEPERALFLEFLMHITFESIIRWNRPKLLCRY